jgi:hypothetical protein
MLHAGLMSPPSLVPTMEAPTFHQENFHADAIRHSFAIEAAHVR